MTNDVFEWILGIMVILVGFFSKYLFTKQQTTIEAIQKEVSEIKIHYLSKEEFKEFKAELREMFHSLKDDIKELKK